MILDTDNITFQSRWEIEVIIIALRKSLADTRRNSSEWKIVTDTIEKLEAMYIRW